MILWSVEFDSVGYILPTRNNGFSVFRAEMVKTKRTKWGLSLRCGISCPFNSVERMLTNEPFL